MKVLPIIFYLVVLLFFLLTVLVGALIAKTLPLDARLRGGRIHFQGGRYQKALEQFEIILKLEPEKEQAKNFKEAILKKKKT